MKRIILSVLCVIMLVTGVLAGLAAAEPAGSAEESAMKEAFAYVHDPRENPEAMKDIVENPTAVYGFSPSPDSTRLRQFADALDWSDPDQVAEARAIRQAYHDSLSELYRMIEDMLGEGMNVEAIARAVNARRNEIRLEAYDNDSEGLELTKKSNLETYGDENGPSADFLYAKYGSWQTVLEKALGVNIGMDVCLGFYDEFYDYYDIGTIVESAAVEWKNLPHEAVELPVDAQAAFDKATRGLLGAHYVPVTLLSTQMANGTNYCILCQITAVVPNAEPTWALVYIHADPDGRATIANVYELYIQKHSEPTESR